MEMIPGLWSLSPLGGLIGILVLAYYLLVTGRLIPRASHERELAAADRRTEDAITRGNEWQKTAQAAHAVNKEQSAQISVLAKSAETAAEFFRTVERGDPSEN